MLSRAIHEAHRARFVPTRDLHEPDRGKYVTTKSYFVLARASHMVTRRIKLLTRGTHVSPLGINVTARGLNISAGTHELYHGPIHLQGAGFVMHSDCINRNASRLCYTGRSSVAGRSRLSIAAWCRGDSCACASDIRRSPGGRSILIVRRRREWQCRWGAYGLR